MDSRFRFSREAETFGAGLTDLEDYAELVKDLDEIYTNPSVDNRSILDHPEGRIAWTPRFGIVFEVRDSIDVRRIFRRGPTPRLDEPFDFA